MKIFGVEYNPVDVSLAVDFLDAPAFQDFLVAQREYELECQNTNELYSTQSRLIDGASGVREMNRDEANELLHKLLMQARDEGKAYGRFSDARRNMFDALFDLCAKHNDDALTNECEASEIATYSEVKCVLKNIASSFGCRLY